MTFVFWFLFVDAKVAFYIVLMKLFHDELFNVFATFIEHYGKEINKNLFIL